MTKQEEKKLVVTDSGNLVRIFGVVAMVGSLGFFQAKMPGLGGTAFNLAGWVFVVVGLGMLLFASDLTITADHATRILRLEYRYWWLFNLTREIPFDEIADLHAERSASTSNGHTSTGGYQLVAVLKNGKKVPFRWYTFTDSGKKQQAARLRAAVGLTHKRPASTADELSAENAEPALSEPDQADETK